jgi:hypothetical protein
MCGPQGATHETALIAVTATAAGSAQRTLRQPRSVGSALRTDGLAVREVAEIIIKAATGHDRKSGQRTGGVR